MSIMDPGVADGTFTWFLLCNYRLFPAYQTVPVIAFMFQLYFVKRQDLKVGVVDLCISCMRFSVTDSTCMACRVAPETLAQYQAHVKRLKGAVVKPDDANSSGEVSKAHSLDAADVINSVQAELVREAAARSKESVSQAQSPDRPPRQAAIPNSTRCAGTRAATMFGSTINACHR